MTGQPIPPLAGQGRSAVTDPLVRQRARRYATAVIEADLFDPAFAPDPYADPDYDAYDPDRTEPDP